MDMNKVYNWWDNLSEQEQYDMMLDWYHDEIKEDTDIDKFFGDMPDGYQMEIYKKEAGNV